jgi:hypothetical protein
VKRQGDAPPGLLWALLFEISEPLDLESLYQGTGRIRDKKFKSWAVPFGVYSKGLLDESPGLFVQALIRIRF